MRIVAFFFSILFLRVFFPGGIQVYWYYLFATGCLVAVHFEPTGRVFGVGAVGVVRGKGAADVDVSRCFLVPGLVAISNPFLVPPHVVDVDHFPFLSVPDATKAKAGRARVFFFISLVAFCFTV